MPIDQLPGALIVPSRAQLVSWFLRDWQLYSPRSRVDKGSEAFLRASVYADQALPLFSNAVLIAANTSRSTMTGAALDNEATSLGTQRFGAVGASGSMSVTTSSGGGTIYQGDLVVIGSNTYQCMATALYASTPSTPAQVPVQGVTTGVGTDQDPGTIGLWQVPRPGIAQSCFVTAQVDGSGLDGGQDTESDDQLRQRLDFIAANPPASGNDAQIIELASRCPGLSIQQAYTYPCIQGPSSTCLVFSLRVTQAGGNPIPNSAQLALMTAWLQAPGNLPADISITVGALVSQPTAIALRPTWAQGVPSWVDATPWPLFTSAGAEPVVGVAVGGNTSTLFRVLNAATAPTIGQNVGVFDLANLTFRRKKILSFTTPLANTYDLTIDTTNAISDTSYTPSAVAGQGAAGQYVFPWSDSLDTLTPAIVAYLGGIGPGEQVPAYQQVDPGSRLRRIPRSPGLYPSIINNRITSGPNNAPFVPYGAPPPPPVPTLDDATSLDDVAVLDVGGLGATLPYLTNIGGAGGYSYQIVLADLGCYP